MIYFLKDKRGLVKIGTTNHWHSRKKSLKDSYGKLELLGCMEGDVTVETQLHKQFAADHVNMRKPGKHEWFRLSPTLQEFIETKAPRNVPLKEGGGMLRISELAHIAFNLHVAATQNASCEIISDEDVFIKLFETHYPDIMGKAREIMAERIEKRRPTRRR